MKKIIIGIATCTVVVLLVVLLFVQFIGKDSDGIYAKYKSLNSRNTESSVVQVTYVVRNEDGTQTIQVTSVAELQKQLALQANGGTTSQVVSIVPGSGYAGGSLSFNPYDMYNKFSLGQGQIVSTVNGIPLYDGLPWADDGKWYQLNTDAVNAYCQEWLGKGLSGDSSWHNDPNLVHNTVDKDGVTSMLIAVYPIFAFCPISDGGNPTGWTINMAAKAKAVAILEKDGKTFYLPMGSGTQTGYYDNKGHTWPGGLVQTYIPNASVVNNNSVVIQGDDNRGKLKWNGTCISQMTTPIPLTDFTSLWSTVVTYKGAIVGATHPMLSIETTSSNKNAFKDYKIVGFLAHDFN